MWAVRKWQLQQLDTKSGICAAAASWNALILPFLQRFSSASSLWIASFIDLFFSFSFPYFFFHCSAVSSRFTDTVFLMVLALIGGIGGKQRESRSERDERGRKRCKKRRNKSVWERLRIETRDCQTLVDSFWSLFSFSPGCSIRNGLAAH